MTRMRLRSWRGLPAVAAIAVLFVVSTVSSVARAEDDVDSSEVATYAVQKRLFRLGLELSAGGGFLPLNAFSKGFVADGSITWHFSSGWAWEIAQGGYVIASLDTGLKNQLLDNFGVQPTQLSTPQFLTSSNIVFTPYYGKLAGLNRTVNHIEIFFPFGLALGRYQNPAVFEQGLDIGIGLRWFLGTHTSLRFDARDYLLFQGFNDFNLTNELLVAIGLSVAFGGEER
jgi:outer membrane beta-barrel protein